MLRGMQNVHRYFPAGTPQKAWGLYVTCAGRSRTEPGAEFPSRAHPDEYYFTWARGRVLDEWQLVLLEEGRGEAELRGRRFALEQGTLLALPPGRWHRYRPDPATGWTTLWVGFGGDMADRIAGIAGLGPDGGVRNLSSRMAVRERFSATVSELLADGGARAFWAAARLHVLVAAIAEEAPDGTGGARARREDVVRRAQAHLAEHCAEVVDYEALAASLGVPYRTFRHHFHRACGVPPHRYRMLVRLERAKRLLESSDLPVAEIADTLGFRSAWHFAHFFQRETGRSAVRYRAEGKRASERILPEE